MQPHIAHLRKISYPPNHRNRPCGVGKAKNGPPSVVFKLFLSLLFFARNSTPAHFRSEHGYRATKKRYDVGRYLRDVSARDRVVDVQSDACVVHRASSIARRRATTTLGSRARVRLDRAREFAWIARESSLGSRARGGVEVGRLVDSRGIYLLVRRRRRRRRTRLVVSDDVGVGAHGE
jgi:hypothetical protein